MAPKGDSNKAKDGTVTVNIDDFTRTRDSVSFFSVFISVVAFLVFVFLLELLSFGLSSRALRVNNSERAPRCFTWDFLTGFGCQHRWFPTYAHAHVIFFNISLPFSFSCFIYVTVGHPSRRARRDSRISSGSTTVHHHITSTNTMLANRSSSALRN